MSSEQGFQAVLVMNHRVLKQTQTKFSLQNLSASLIDPFFRNAPGLYQFNHLFHESRPVHVHIHTSNDTLIISFFE